jgi:predicted SprT family Zn-dependent metalloprotease
VLCHELAHLAARERHGDRIRPHGPEWKALMRAAGYEPKTRLPLPKSLTKAAHPGPSELK